MQGDNPLKLLGGDDDEGEWVVITQLRRTWKHVRQHASQPGKLTRRLEPKTGSAIFSPPFPRPSIRSPILNLSADM